jgi:uncharacterized protein (TIGR03382 family)
MAELAQKAYAQATTPEQRARACNREAGAWDGLGRHTEVLKATTRGLQETGVSPEFRRVLESNLANAYYSLWALVESRSIAQNLLETYRENPPRSVRDRKTHAFAHYVSGHTFRRLLSVEPERSQTLAASARADLEPAGRLYRQLAAEVGDESLAGIAQTCHGGLIEVDVELGRRSATDALAELSAGLERVRDTSQELVGDRLESYGWWCIFGCNIALRHLSDERDLQQHMAVFTNKADEIANLLDNWSMRERVFTMQYTRWERALGSTGFDIPCVIDSDDVRVITGTMGRFPTFRDTSFAQGGPSLRINRGVEHETGHTNQDRPPVAHTNQDHGIPANDIGITPDSGLFGLPSIYGREGKPWQEHDLFPPAIGALFLDGDLTDVIDDPFIAVVAEPPLSEPALTEIRPIPEAFFDGSLGSERVVPRGLAQIPPAGPIPAPGALPVLGLAAATLGRRRRGR